MDFLNTRPVQNGKPMELLPDFRALLRWFQAARLISTRDMTDLQRQWGKSARAKRTVEAMHEVRERLRKEILAWEQGGAIHRSTVAELNRLMVDHPMLTRLKASGSASSTELWFGPRQPEDLFAPLAHSAATLFANVDHAYCISMTRAKRGPGAGAACSYVETASRSRPMLLASAKVLTSDRTRFAVNLVARRLLIPQRKSACPRKVFEKFKCGIGENGTLVRCSFTDAHSFKTAKRLDGALRRPYFWRTDGPARFL